jgi:hypothetical protein
MINIYFFLHVPTSKKHTNYNDLYTIYIYIGAELPMALGPTPKAQGFSKKKKKKKEIIIS